MTKRPRKVKKNKKIKGICIHVFVHLHYAFRVEVARFGGEVH